MSNRLEYFSKVVIFLDFCSRITLSLVIWLNFWSNSTTSPIFPGLEVLWKWQLNRPPQSCSSRGWARPYTTSSKHPAKGGLSVPQSYHLRWKCTLWSLGCNWRACGVEKRRPCCHQYDFSSGLVLHTDWTTHLRLAWYCQVGPWREGGITRMNLRFFLRFGCHESHLIWWKLSSRLMSQAFIASSIFPFL